VLIVLAIFVVLVQRQIKRPLPFLSSPRSAAEVPVEMPAPPPVLSTEGAAEPRSRAVSDEEVRRQMPPDAIMVE
jgi:hypothetical protein